MRRQGNLWDRMISFESLLLAAHAAARGKRFKPGVARFAFDLDGAPPGISYDGAVITITAVAAEEAIEVSAPLD